MSSLGDLAGDGPSIPMLLKELPPGVVAFATETAHRLHDWLELEDVPRPRWRPCGG